MYRHFEVFGEVVLSFSLSPTRTQYSFLRQSITLSKTHICLEREERSLRLGGTLFLLAGLVNGSKGQQEEE